MLERLRRNLTYANAMSTIAVIFAVGTGGAYAANTVFSGDIADGEVKTADIATKAVTNDKLGTSSVGNSKILGSSITTSKIYNGSLTSIDMKANGLTGDAIDESSLTIVPLAASATLADTATVANGVADGAVGEAGLDDDAVTSANTKNDSLTGDDIDESTLTGLSTGASAPTGAVMHFNLAACPDGWEAMTSARGRYLVGQPEGGTLAGTKGTALSDLENRAVGQHDHGITDPGHDHRAVINSSTFHYAESGYNEFKVTSGAVNYQTGSATTGITINSAGTTDGTNAPYLQLLVCQKS